MPTTTTNSKGEWKFDNLAEGLYDIVPGDQDGKYVFKPAKYTLQVDANWKGVNFYGALANHPPTSAPALPYKEAASAPFGLRGKITPDAGDAHGVKGIVLVLTPAQVGSDPDEENPDPETPVEPASIRLVPAGLLAHKSSTRQSTCFCWAIKPRVGDWEGFSSFIRNLDLPEYESLPGDSGATSTIPALQYKCVHGVSPTAIPTRLDLGKDGVQVTVLAFDRDKLLRGFYEGAQIELFEINYRGDVSERLVWLSGLVGNATVGDLSATVELVTWPDLANRTIGRTFGPTCDVGRPGAGPIGEEFGTHRCRNLVLEDGPLKADWTVLAEVETVEDGSDSHMIFTVSFGATALSGAALHADFKDHLAHGRVLFQDGNNAGVVREIKSGDEVDSGGTGIGIALALKSPLPFAPEVGETLHLTVGCNRMPDDCKFFNNFPNFRGFIVPGREAVLRRFS